MPLFDALIEAGKVRLRPILMTTATTVLAMLPLVIGFGDGAETQASMATVVAFGLTLSTLVTLVLIPVVYTLLDGWMNGIKKRFKRNRLQRRSRERQFRCDSWKIGFRSQFFWRKTQVNAYEVSFPKESSKEKAHEKNET